MLAKIGPWWNSNRLFAWLKIDTPVTSDGSRSGVNWMRVHCGVDAGRDGTGEGGLTHARDVLEEQVALAEQADQGQLDVLPLAADDALDVARERAEQPREPSGECVRVGAPYTSTVISRHTPTSGRPM